MKTQTHDKETGKITLNEYDDGFLDNEIDVTSNSLTFVCTECHDNVLDLDRLSKLLQSFRFIN